MVSDGGELRSSFCHIGISERVSVITAFKDEGVVITETIEGLRGQPLGRGMSIHGVKAVTTLYAYGSSGATREHLQEGTHHHNAGWVIPYTEYTRKIEDLERLKYSCYFVVPQEIQKVSSAYWHFAGKLSAHHSQKTRLRIGTEYNELRDQRSLVARHERVGVTRTQARYAYSGTTQFGQKGVNERTFVEKILEACGLSRSTPSYKHR